MSLQPGEALGVSREITNKAAQVAILLTSSDYDFLGWMPRYLVNDLLKAISEKPSVVATVVRVNVVDVPANRRVLVELTGTLPAELQPISAEEFQPLISSPATQ